jgi:hypothetical protein
MHKKLFILLVFTIAQSSIAMDLKLPDETSFATEPLGERQNTLLTQFFFASLKDDIDETEKLIIEKDFPVDGTIDATEFSVLMWCARHGLDAQCKLLLDRNADINSKTTYNMTALLCALDGLHPSTCQLLLERGARSIFHINNLHPISGTDLHFASFRWLLWSKDQLNFLKPLGRTEMSKESMRRDSEAICELLINHQERINGNIKTTLLCLNHIKRDKQALPTMRASAGELYRQFKTLLLPYLGDYLTVQQMLTQKDPNGNRPYDYLPIDCLKQKSSRFELCSIQ